MQYRQSLLDVERSATVTVLIDFDALRLQAVDRDGNEIDQSFASLAELERTYRKRVAPLFADERCEDLDRGSPATPITSMTAFANELRECGYDWVEQPRVVGDAVEGFVAELMTKIRRELNRALGAEDATLEHVVLLVGDSLIKPAVKDPPAIAGLGEEEIERVIGGGKSPRWLRGEGLDFSLSHESLPWGELPSLWVEPWQYGPYGLLGAALDLVAARIEANPRLRANVSIPGPLRIFVAFREMEFVVFERRALARKHVDGRALAYFEQCGREAPGSRQA